MTVDHVGAGRQVIPHYRIQMLSEGTSMPEITYDQFQHEIHTGKSLPFPPAPRFLLVSA